MRTTLIILALVVLLGFASEAGAELVDKDVTFRIAGHRFGFYDSTVTTSSVSVRCGIDSDGKCVRSTGTSVKSERVVTTAYIGPLGESEVSFTATQGLVGFIVIVAVLFIVPIVVVVGWKRKQAFP